MNTKTSVAYGWGILVLAGGGVYYFAKRSINSERAERAGARNRSRTAQTSEFPTTTHLKLDGECNSPVTSQELTEWAQSQHNSQQLRRWKEIERV